MSVTQLRLPSLTRPEFRQITTPLQLRDMFITRHWSLVGVHMATPTTRHSMLPGDNKIDKRLSTPNPEHSFPLGSTLCYVRSSCLTIKQLLAVIVDWDANVLFFKEADAWKRATEHQIDDSVKVYIRYVDMSRTTSPYSRFATDLEAKTRGVYGAFIPSLSKDFTFS